MYSWLTGPEAPGEMMRAVLLDALILLAAGLVAGLGFKLLAWRRRRAREALPGGHLKRAGMFVPDQIAPDAAFLASMGTGRAAPETLGTRVMRAAPGIRLLVLAVTALILGLGLRSGGTPVELALLAGCSWSLIWVFGYELRWNREHIVLKRAFLPSPGGMVRSDRHPGRRCA